MKMTSILSLCLLLGMSLVLKTDPAYAGKDCGERLGSRGYYGTATTGRNSPSLGILVFDTAASHAQEVNGVFNNFVFGPYY